MSSAEDRLPYPAVAASRANLDVREIPVSILLDQVRSLYNVGAFFRVADAAGLARLYLVGITAHPPHAKLRKTALGAEERVPWEHRDDPVALAEQLHDHGHELAAVETSPRAVDLYQWQPRFPVCVVFGHETDGIRPALAALCDSHVRIPMLGGKHSLNVAVAGGIVAYELLRKYRELVRESRAARLLP